MTAIRLVDYCYSRRDEKEPEFFKDRNRYVAEQDNFSKIPGSPVAYWLSKNGLSNFEKGISVDSISDFTGAQHKTADNDRFLRQWWEPSAEKIYTKDWVFILRAERIENGMGI